MILPSTELVLRSLDATWDYARWTGLPEDGNRYEIINGVLYITTAPGSFHQWITGRLWHFVGIPLEDRGVAYAYSAPIVVLMPGCNPVQPDFLLVRHERAGIIRDGRIYGPPDLIVEILPPAILEHDTLTYPAPGPEHDTDTKRQAYARAGVPEYWIIRSATGDLLLHWQPDPLVNDCTQAQTVASGATLASPTLPVQLTRADLFADAPDRTL